MEATEDLDWAREVYVWVPVYRRKCCLCKERKPVSGGSTQPGKPFKCADCKRK